MSVNPSQFFRLLISLALYGYCHGQAIPLLHQEQVAELVVQGASILDTRSPERFAAGHYKGSINVGFGMHLGEWASTLLDRQKPVIVIADPEHESEVLTQLARAGFENLAGRTVVPVQQELLDRQERLLALELHQQMLGPKPPVLIDVRTPLEFTQGHLAGARNIPLQEFLARLGEIPDEGPVVILCQSGYRSSIAASLLGTRPGINELAGGYRSWTEKGLPVIRPGQVESH